MPNPIYNPDKVMVEDQDTAAPQKTHCRWFSEGFELFDIPTPNVPPILREQEVTRIVPNETQIQLQEEQPTDHDYLWIEMPSGEIFGGGGVTVVNIAAVGSTVVFGGNLAIREQMSDTYSPIGSAMLELGSLTQDSEQLTRDRCRKVLLDFASYAKKILKHKEIAITDTRIRNWQAIEDSSWKQCILDITIKTESHIALSIWDELTEELQKFISTQPELTRSFIEDKLSLDVKWV